MGGEAAEDRSHPDGEVSGLEWDGMGEDGHLPFSALCLHQFSSWEQLGNLTVQLYARCLLGTPVSTRLACMDMVCSEKLP